MIPSVLAGQVRRGVVDFLRTTYPIAGRFFRTAHGGSILDDLLAEQVFKGPYLSLALPFQSAGPDYVHPFPAVPLAYTPYRHQVRAFERLSQPQARSSLIATGTGSGKTECFLLPILDACLRTSPRPGVKAILIYPMNALASDQAGRLARLIWDNPQLRGHVSAGIYVGGEGGRRAMDRDGLVSDRETLRLKPPDILLTNYKMLDYLLLRAEDTRLWAENGPETLRYLVVDELHTFDGAQGTDLACLIRRLKSRLAIAPGALCCVGTSATLGGGSGGRSLIDYAAQIFAEPFDAEAVISEQRVDRLEAGDEPAEAIAQTPGDVADLDPQGFTSAADYLAAQIRLWLPSSRAAALPAGEAGAIALGNQLQRHLVLDALLAACGGRPRSLSELAEKIWPEREPVQAERLLVSFLSLISAARKAGRSGPRPLLDVRLQAWMRELTRLVCAVTDPPELRFADDLSDEQRRGHLPLAHCRDCGATAWVGVKRADEERVAAELQVVYQAYFARDPKLVLLYPDPEAGLDPVWLRRLCGHCLNLQPAAAGDCGHCGEAGTILVWAPSLRRKKTSTHGSYQVADKTCQVCASGNELSLLGSRAASLISVQIAQLFGSPYNDDKKLLTFSDSVQDAAHRAGFFAARTWRFTLRAALQQFVDAAGEGLDLAALPKAFCDFWRERLGEARFLAEFMPPDALWRDSAQAFLRDGVVPAGSELARDVARRAGWEIVAEYGFGARIGRTLEKSGVSIAQVDESLLAPALTELLPRLQNQVGSLRGLQADELARFVSGLLERGRTQGAILTEGLGSYFSSGNTFIVQKILWMPNFGSRRAPRFWCDGRFPRFEPLFGATRGRMSWIEEWLHKTLFARCVLVGDEHREAVALIFAGLCQAGILVEERGRQGAVWGLLPQALTVTRQVTTLVCDICGQGACCGGEQRPRWQQTACLRSGCPGHYSAATAQADYYGRLYAHAHLQRIYAQEHTGLLERDEREDLERRFKAVGEARQPGFPNLLSCTPTLEMGIDIGDLSSLILCSVPPDQANYLQRIGRAGRKDGNALNLTLANGRNHDLYFFAEPREMIAGNLTTPGVFLEASAVLERQLMAFCLDNWVQVTGSALPRFLNQLLAGLKKADPARFPHSLLRWLASRRESLLDRFCALFPQMSAATRSHLEAFLQGDGERVGSLGYRILNGLHGARAEVASLAAAIKKLNRREADLEGHPARDRSVEEELKELRRERAGLRGVLKKIRDRATLQYFADEGLLPNYAFPEAGVLLRSIIYRKQQGGEDAPSWTYEYERPASSALVELAPESAFYAGGHKVQVSRIDLRQSEIESWRFCDRCPYSAREGEGTPGRSCPRCGSLMWADQGQKRAMVRLRAVYANTSARRAQIGDDKDEREPAFFLRSMLVNVAPEQVHQAWRIDNEQMPFGYEYVMQAEFREINFGVRDGRAEEVTIAGEKEARKGFHICSRCGTVQPKDKPAHAYGCAAATHEDSAHYVECLYLYREFSSEALRMLLPVTSFANSKRVLQSFIAALQLGLKRRFGGSIDHLRSCEQDEPVAGEDFRKQYLVLFDTVPGGTGYLKQLAREPGALVEVLALALDHLKACRCGREPDKDGCYRCLFAYRQSYSMAETSRDQAITTLSEMVALSKHMVAIPNLSGVSVNALFESELEARFVEALRGAVGVGGARPLRVRKEVVRGKPGYHLQVDEQEYLMEPQVMLGPRESVTIPSRADFVIRPLRERPGLRPLAIFVDGYSHHRDRLGADLAQRMAIVASGGYRTWSLTWSDIETRLKPGAAPRECALLAPCLTGFGRQFLNQLAENRVMRGLVNEDSFTWLERWLQCPDDALWARTAVAHFLCWLDGEKRSDGRWWQELSNRFPQEMIEALQLPPALAGGFPSKPESWGHFHLAALPQAARSLDPYSVRLLGWIDDGEDKRRTPEFQETWQRVLHVWNLAQFLPHALLVTRQGLTDKVTAGLQFAPTPAAAEDWDELLELVLEEALPLARALAVEGLPLPEAGYELTEEGGEVLAQAELAWPDRKMAVLDSADQVSQDAFTKAGWRLFSLNSTATQVAAALT